MDKADFGPLIEGDDPVGGFGSWLSGKFPKITGKFKTTLDDTNTFLGGIDFFEAGLGGRLRFLSDRFLNGDTGDDSTFGGINLTNLRNSSTPFGRTPKIPTRYVNSQAGPFGKVEISKGGIYYGGGPYWTSSPARYSSMALGAPTWHWSYGQAPRSSNEVGYITLPYENLGLKSAYTRVLDKKWREMIGDENFNSKAYILESGKLVHQKKSDSAIIRHSWRFLNLPIHGPSGIEKYSGEDDYFDGLDDIDTIHGLDERVFPPHTSKGPDALEPDSLIKQYSTLSYGRLNKLSGYGEKIDFSKGGIEIDPGLSSPSEYNRRINRTSTETDLQVRLQRVDNKKIVDGTGQQGQSYIIPAAKEGEDPGEPIFSDESWDDTTDGAGLGLIKTGVLGNYKNELTDKINIHPYGKDLPEDVSDFVKFKFKDLVNDKFIIFRAILSGISDSITPEWTGTRYIGRPDQVYVYSGTERKISFNFEIYPKTKQEFPVLMEKLNYLIGLCYPSYTSDNRMIAPFIELTLGDMFNKTPGFLDSLSVDVDDTGTWEIEEGLQFPKHITCACSFTYVGKYLPSSLGKHYELPWLTDNGWTGGLSKGEGATYGTFNASQTPDPEGGNFPIKSNPERIGAITKLFDNLGAVDAESV
jgi:hypothetical protein